MLTESVHLGQRMIVNEVKNRMLDEEFEEVDIHPISVTKLVCAVDKSDHISEL